MRLLSSLRTFLNFMFRRQRVEHDMEEELRSHIQDRADDLERQGLARAEAERQARIEFGGYQRYKEECRETLGTRLLQELIADVRYGLRQLRRNPGFTAVAVITLALGIGANTAIFSVVSVVLLQSLPYPAENQLSALWEVNRYGDDIQVSGADFEDWKAQNKIFAGMAAYLAGPMAVSGGRHPGDAVAILSYGLWQQNYGSKPGIIGRPIKIEGKDCTVVGVMPPGFSFPESAEVWFPLEFTGSVATQGDRSAHNFKVIGRLKPGISLSTAQAEMRTIAARLGRQYPSSNRNIGAAVIPLRRQLEGDTRPALLILFAAVAFVLLIACANVANLLLARATTRRKEMAVRTAMGATRRRLLGQLLTESILLALIGGACGLILAFWTKGLLTTLAPSSVAQWGQIHVDGRVLLFAVTLSLLTGIICGIIPALRASRPDLNEALKESGTRAGSAQGQHRLRGVLIISEIALALLLLAGAGLLIRTFLNIQGVSLGFRAHDILVADVSLPSQTSRYTDLRRVIGFYDQALTRIRAIPGVRSAATIDLPPLGSFDRNGEFAIAGRPVTHSIAVSASYRVISPGYFRTMGIPIVRGRDFDSEDSAAAPAVVIINAAMARRFWPSQNPIGAQIRFYGFGSVYTWMRVLAIVGDTRSSGLEFMPAPTAYVPYSQHAGGALNGMNLVVQTAVPPSAVEAAVRATVDSLDSTVPVVFSTMRQRVGQQVAGSRFRTLLLGCLALLAVTLAAFGIYGVMAYMVAERTHEIGIRMALGAQKRDVLRLVVGQRMILTLIGVGIGIIGALGLTRFLSSLLYGVKPTDPLTFIVVSLILTGVALLACYIPARRAMKIDPMEALRYE